MGKKKKEFQGDDISIRPLCSCAGHMPVKPALGGESEGTPKGENAWFRLRAPGLDNTATSCQFHALKVA